MAAEPEIEVTLRRDVTGPAAFYAGSPGTTHEEVVELSSPDLEVVVSFDGATMWRWLNETAERRGWR